jgi:uncharacterized damage-inducible protein DinB
MSEESQLKAQMERVALELLEGRGAHADPLASIDDLTGELASHRPAGFAHSIFEIVAHLNNWMEYDMKRMRGAPDPYPEHAAQSWPSAQNVENTPWSKEVERFRELQQQLARVCRLGIASWLSQAPAMHASHERNASTVGAMIFQTITHNSYHIGQIDDLRRALDAWPPASGGDTW